MNMIIGAAAMTPAATITNAEAGFTANTDPHTVPPPAGEVRLDLMDARDLLGIAEDALCDAEHVLFIAEEKLEAWLAANPEPVMSNDFEIRDDETISDASDREATRVREMHRPWLSQHIATLVDLQIGPHKKAMMEAEAAYNAAIEAFAVLPATNMAEAFYKAETSLSYDGTRNRIAAHLAWDLLDIQDSVETQEAERVSMIPINETDQSIPPLRKLDDLDLEVIAAWHKADRATQLRALDFARRVENEQEALRS